MEKAFRTFLSALYAGVLIVLDSGAAFLVGMALSFAIIVLGILHPLGAYLMAFILSFLWGAWIQIVISNIAKTKMITVHTISTLLKSFCMVGGVIFMLTSFATHILQKKTVEVSFLVSLFSASASYLVCYHSDRMERKKNTKNEPPSPSS